MIARLGGGLDVELGLREHVERAHQVFAGEPAGQIEQRLALGVGRDLRIRDARGIDRQHERLDLAQQQLWQTIPSANNLELRAVLPKPLPFETQVAAQQPEDTLDLECGSTPVVRRECIKCQGPDAQIERLLNEKIERWTALESMGQGG